MTRLDIMPYGETMAWVTIDGSKASAREGLQEDADRQGLIVVKWGDPPITRYNSKDSIEWLCWVAPKPSHP